MKEKRKIVALIPLRGGSKSIPKKNIKTIAGKPLCAWVLESVSSVSVIDEIYVSTEDEEIMETVKSIDSKIIIINRPFELATDDASTESVMLHFAKTVNFDVIVTLQVTSPLTRPIDIINGLSKFFSNKLNSLVTGVRVKRFFWDFDNKPLNYDYQNRPRRQNFKGWIMENGAFYITDYETLTKSQCRLGGKIGVLEMPEETMYEIDEPKDWVIVERFLLARKRSELSKCLKEIKLFVVDVDGTLTDGGMYYTNQGEHLKKFNTRDAKGIELLRKKGILVVLMTSEDSEIVRKRAQKLKLEHVFLGVKNKLMLLQEFCLEIKVKFPNVAYIGDDVNDLEVISEVGFSACPADAVPPIKEKSIYICQKKGGEGAVREICELILSVLQ